MCQASKVLRFGSGNLIFLLKNPVNPKRPILDSWLTDWHNTEDRKSEQTSPPPQAKAQLQEICFGSQGAFSKGANLTPQVR